MESDYVRFIDHIFVIDDESVVIFIVFWLY
jgi:hypothetical protein